MAQPAQRALAVAGEKDVTVVGGANTAQQIISAGLFDELQIGIVPILLGSGLRFFDNLSSIENMRFEILQIFDSHSRIDLGYRIVKV